MGCIWMKWDECTFSDWEDEEVDAIDDCEKCPHFKEYFPENEEYAKHDAQLRGWDWREARGDYD